MKAHVVLLALRAARRAAAQAQLPSPEGAA
jgi:hypothetical protein